MGLFQLGNVERADARALEIVRLDEPTQERAAAVAEISISTDGWPHAPHGIKLRDRERFHVLIPKDFPFDPPAVWTTHVRWAGTSHVQWRRYLCLYQATETEWNPADGMYGFLDRLEYWLRRAALGELDPADAPLHPPAVYTSSRAAPMIIPRVDAPSFDRLWVGSVDVERVGDRRVDLVGWNDDIEGWRPGAAPAVLLSTPMDWEYPRTVRDLIDILQARGVPRDILFAALRVGASKAGEDQPMVMVIGTPMRGRADDRRQHLAAWYLEPTTIVTGLQLSLYRESENDKLREIGVRVEEIMSEWATGARLAWCQVREDRPEIVQRRDSGSRLRAFDGKTVAVWGCGALGAPIAEWLARANVARLILYDQGLVAPGLLVRQPFTDLDIGHPKAEIVAARVSAIRPQNLEVDVHVEDVLRGPLARDDWHDGADIVIDATASERVRSKLEFVRHKHGARQAVCCSMLVGHDAQRAALVLCNAGYSGGPSDVLLQVKLRCARRGELRHYLDEFWPDPPRTEMFQPEPGCSDPTFQGSGAEAGALAGALLYDAGRYLTSDASGGHAVLRDLSGADATSRAELAFSPALVLRDTMEGYEIRIAREALAQLDGWIRRSTRVLGDDVETGGLLFGERDDAAGVIWVNEVIGPPPDSRCSADEFVCGIQGVEGFRKEKARRGRGSLDFVGMWHTHPNGRPTPSPRDVAGMAEIVLGEDPPLPLSLLVIVGDTIPEPSLGAYVFTRQHLRNPSGIVRIEANEAPTLAQLMPRRDVGLALSGGGSRAIAFHLGCLRALWDRDVLDRVQVISSVSGGAVMAAAWAYSDADFEVFDDSIQEVLRRGLSRAIARKALLGRHALGALATQSTAGALAVAATLSNPVRKRISPRRAPLRPPLRRWVSRTEAFADVLADRLFGSTLLTGETRDDVGVVINACELRTGSAFRFGNRESGCWRVGRVVDNAIPVSSAVAASAAFPALLPALDREWSFRTRDGATARQRVVLTDGGVFDNTGTTCLEPGRSEAYSYNVYSVDYIIACDAGRGLLSDDVIPFHLPSRVMRSFDSVYRKVQDAARSRLHSYVAAGDLKGFVLPYLGQMDDRLPVQPADLISRERVATYPTDFSPMAQMDLDALADRGEQLTRLLLDLYCPEI